MAVVQGTVRNSWSNLTAVVITDDDNRDYDGGSDVGNVDELADGPYYTSVGLVAKMVVLYSVLTFVTSECSSDYVLPLFTVSI